MPDLTQLTGIAINVLTVILLITKFSVKKESREITPQPLLVRNDADPVDRFAARAHEHNNHLTHDAHDKLCAARFEESRHIIKHATADREAIQRQLDTISNTVAVNFKELAKHNEESAGRLHRRMDAFIETLSTLKGRVENHIQEHGK